MTTRRGAEGVRVPSEAGRLRDERQFLVRLRSAIDGSRLSQRELADRLGCNASTVTEWFARGSMPKGHILMYLPRILGVSGTWLLSGDGPHEAAEHKAGTSSAYLGGAREVLAQVEASLQAVRRDWEGRVPSTAPASGEDHGAVMDEMNRHAESHAPESAQRHGPPTPRKSRARRRAS